MSDVCLCKSCHHNAKALLCNYLLVQDRRAGQRFFAHLKILTEQPSLESCTITISNLLLMGVCAIVIVMTHEQTSLTRFSQ